MIFLQINEIESRLKSTTPKMTPLLLKPSPRVKTPDRTLDSESDDDSDDNYPRNPKQLQLNRVPRASAATNQVTLIIKLDYCFLSFIMIITCTTSSIAMHKFKK